MKNLKYIAALALASLTLACQPTDTTTNTTNTAATVTNRPANANVVNGNSASPATNANSTTNANGNVSTSSNAANEALQIAEAGVAMNLPAGFKSKQEAGKTVVTAPDGVEIHFHVPTDATFEKSVTGASTEVGKYVKDAKPAAKTEKMNINGMDAFTADGTGTGKDGKPVAYDMTVINAPKKPLFVVSYGEQASLQKHAAEIDALTKSIKKM